MHKFGAGEVQHDPEDPQGIPVQSTVHQGSRTEVQQELAVENTQADAVQPTTGSHAPRER